MDFYDQPLHEHRFRAMGSTFALWLIHTDAALAAALLSQAQNVLAAIETRMTRFAATSELSALNRASGQWTSLSRPLWEVVWRALQLAGETGGLFDPTVLTAVLAAGYDRSFDQIGRRSASLGTTEQRATGCWQAVRCDPARHAILLPAGVGLDLGGIAKGYAAEIVVTYLSQWGPCLVDAGGDLVAGDGPADFPGWPVAIAMPAAARDAEPATAVPLWLSNATLATSGIDYRRWQQDGRHLHHLIDPRTGLPATNNILTASVLCADACRAEAWATATLVAGEDEGMARLQAQELAGVMIEPRAVIHQTRAMQRHVMVDARVSA